MTTPPQSPRAQAPRPGGRSRAGRRGGPSVTPAQLLVAGLVLAVFIAGLVIGGVVGAVLVGVLAVAAGVLLVLRWNVLSGRVRLVRAFAVIIALAVAVSLLWR